MGENDTKAEKQITVFTENYMAKLFYFCLKKTGNRADAEDLTQDITLHILSALKKGTIPTRFSAWVWQIARNRYSVWADRKHRKTESVTGSDIGDYEIVDASESALNQIIRAEELATLRRELSFIGSEYRNIVVTYYLDHVSIREIARSLSLSEAAVKQRLYRARKILKEGMDMAREFGKLSYSPENISFNCNGLFGENGEPYNFLHRSLCKNILLAAYRNPSTAEELSVEVGVALPYMEEELADLTSATLMKRNGNKYETNFFIVSAEAQEKIYAHLHGITPELTTAVIDALEFEVSWKNENCPRWHEGYQPYEDMKWTLLMYQTDIIQFDTLDAFNEEQKVTPKGNLGKWGHTLRPNKGEWDILGLEDYKGKHPSFVGLHGCISSPAERDLPEISFQQFKFNYKGIASKTPNIVPYAYAQALVSVAQGETEGISDAVLDFLVKNGYIEKTNMNYKPTFLVMFADNQKKMPADVLDTLESRRRKARDIAMRHYRFCREQIIKEIPVFLKDDAYQIDHACANIFTLRGAVLEEALQRGYLHYAGNDDRKMLGTFLRI